MSNSNDWRSGMLKIVIGALALTLLSGCSNSVRQHIRQYDFRESSRGERGTFGAPSPIANVFDMPGWTSDLEGATAFAAANNRDTVVFVRRAGESASERVVVILNGRQGEAASKGSERVAIDIAQTPSLAASLGVTETPAIVVLNPQGSPIASQSGPMEKSRVLSLLGAK